MGPNDQASAPAALSSALQECNDERDELFCKYLWDGGTETAWQEIDGQLLQVSREIVPDITRMMDETEPAGKVCPYVPSPMARVRRVASFACITANDVVLDIGCGDGRVLLHLAQETGCRGVGLEIDPELVQVARGNAAAATAVVGSRLSYRVADMLQPEQLAPYVGAASCILLYLIAPAMVQLHDPLVSALMMGAEKARPPTSAMQQRVVTQVYHYVLPAGATPIAHDKPWKLCMYSADDYTTAARSGKRRVATEINANTVEITGVDDGDDDVEGQEGELQQQS